MGNGFSRVALWALAFLVLANVLASIPGAQAASTPNYTLLGYASQAGGVSAPPVPAGVSVDLISAASHQTYSTTTTTAGGSFAFNAANTGSTLAPGWWGVWVPPQAHVNVYGCKPCAVLPSNQNPAYYWENSTSLTTQSTPDNPVSISGVQLLPYNATIWGNTTFLGAPVAGATVQLLDPTFNGFVLANNTTVSQATNTTVVGEFSLSVPYGTWVLQTTVPGSPNYYNTVQVTVNAKQITVNPTVQKNFYAWGYVNQKATPSAHVPAGGNATVFDPTNGFVYTSPISSGYYSVATYPAGFTGPGNQVLDVVLAPVGWQAVSYQLNVSTALPGGSAAHVSYTAPVAPPASYQTTLNFSSGFGKVNVTTAATLGNDSTFPDLANASVGQLWAQLALDFQNNLTFDSSNLDHVLGWINSAGPFFPAGQNLLTVNGTGFGQPTNYTFTNSTTCVTFCGLTSNAGLSLNWAQSYNVTGKLPTNAKTYALSFTFRHPTNMGAYNYTVVLPTGWVLNAGSATPPQSRLVAGPGGTWTKFTLVSQPSASASSTASFTIVKYSSVTANVNVTTSNFAFSKANVLNQTHGNYTVVVGVGENATFSALNSTFPAGNNGTLYQWTFGDGSSTNTTQPTTYHTYAGAGSSYLGSLKVTSSGGQTSTVSFHVYTDDATPAAVISTNATIQHTGGGSYVQLNSSQTLHFNASASSDLINSGTGLKGVLSVASWNISTGTSPVTLANYSTGANLKFGSNLTVQFNGAGSYLTSADVNGTPVAFTGWQYNVSLDVWDGAGHLSRAYLDVLVNDHQKPTPVIALQDVNGRTVSSSGIVEGASNHTAQVVLSAQNSTDPHNGSIVQYSWKVTNSGNSSVNLSLTQPATMPGFKLPAKPHFWLEPQAKPYTVNLTVTDRANNVAYVVSSLTVAINTSQRPVLSVTNLTAPGTMTDGSSYTVWVNVTNTIGKNSTAQGLSVRFYLLSPSGVGSGTTIGGSPSSVLFYNYTSNTTVTANPVATGTMNLAYNKTVRAVITFKPETTGTLDLWANASASNEFISDYKTGANQMHVSVTLNQNPLVLYEEIGGVVAVAAVIIVVIILLRRRGSSPKASTSKGSSSAKAGSEKSKKDEDDEDE